MAADPAQIKQDQTLPTATSDFANDLTAASATSTPLAQVIASETKKPVTTKTYGDGDFYGQYPTLQATLDQILKNFKKNSCLTCFECFCAKSQNVVLSHCL